MRTWNDIMCIACILLLAPASPHRLSVSAAIGRHRGRERWRGAHDLWCASSAALFTALSSGTEHLPICEHLPIWPASGLAES